MSIDSIRKESHDFRLGDLLDFTFLHRNLGAYERANILAKAEEIGLDRIYYEIRLAANSTYSPANSC